MRGQRPPQATSTAQPSLQPCVLSCVDERKYTMTMTRKLAGAVLFTGLLSPAASLLAQGPPQGYNQRYGQGQGYGPGQGQGYGPGQGPGGYGQGGWDAPPSNFTRDIQRNGFRDGIEGARKDAQNRRSINVRNRDEYRNYRGPDRRAYRQAFERGYQTFWNHQRGPGPGQGYGPGGPRPY